MPGKMSPTILVVGGGFAGRAAIRYFTKVADNASIILVDQKPFFEFTPAVLRCIVHPEHLKRITFKQNVDPEVSFLRGKVTYITGHEATVVRRDDDRVTVFSIPFDYCVWATGVRYSQPISSPIWQHNPTLARRRGEFSYFRHRILSATEILIIGAGPIGVELCAELVGARGSESTPQITLAASPRGVLPRFPARAGAYAHDWLSRRGVRILAARFKAGNRLSSGAYQYRDESDPPMVISPDLVFECTGARSNDATSALVAGGVCDGNSVQQDGALMVLDTLQLPDAPHIFVVGDASRVPGELEMDGLACEKTAYAAEESGKLAARNIAMLMRAESLISGRSQRLHRYPIDVFPRRRFPRLFVVSLYKYHGILCVGPLVISGVIPSGIKFFIELFGVSSAEVDSVVSSTFRLLERTAYFCATMFTFMSAWFQSRDDN